MTQNDAIRFARFYLWNEGCFGPDGNALRSDLGGKNRDGEITDYTLHRSLQYWLCGAFTRLSRTFGEGEIVNKDIAHIVDAWVLSSRNHWERMGFEDSGWRTLPGLVRQNEVQPTATAISNKRPDFKQEFREGNK